MIPSVQKQHVVQHPFWTPKGTVNLVHLPPIRGPCGWSLPLLPTPVNQYLLKNPYDCAAFSLIDGEPQILRPIHKDTQKNQTTHDSPNSSLKVKYIPLQIVILSKNTWTISYSKILMVFYLLSRKFWTLI